MDKYLLCTTGFSLVTFTIFLTPCFNIVIMADHVMILMILVP
jgi:hypothetical protein